VYVQACACCVQVCASMCVCVCKHASVCVCASMCVCASIGVCVHTQGCHMLGKTHEVTAPTRLLKVMESAVVKPGITCVTQPARHSRVLLCANARPQQH
jgi:hypothetical protein